MNCDIFAGLPEDVKRYSWYEHAERKDLTMFDLQNSAEIHKLRSGIEKKFDDLRTRLLDSIRPGVSCEYVNAEKGYKLRVAYGRSENQNPPATGTGVRTDQDHWVTYVFDYKGQPYLFGPRGWFYGDYHMSLGAATAVNKHDLRAEQLELALVLTQILGPEYEGFQNRIADSQPHYHVQFLRLVTTIWDARNLEQYPATTDLLTDGNCPRLAESVLKEWKAKELKIEFDLLFRSLSQAEAAVILLPRERSKKRPRISTLLSDSFVSEEKRHIGDFGTLEMAGYLGTLKSPEAYNWLAQEKNCANYDKAITEVTWPRPKHRE